MEGVLEEASIFPLPGWVAMSGPEFHARDRRSPCMQNEVFVVFASLRNMEV